MTCINVFLDEFLYGILSAARSLTTDKLRAGLLSVLPTALGKEALLEAEVELRAYWDRTKPSKNGAVDDDAATFNLQWAFEVRAGIYVVIPSTNISSAPTPQMRGVFYLKRIGWRQIRGNSVT